MPLLTCFKSCKCLHYLRREPRVTAKNVLQYWPQRVREEHRRIAQKLHSLGGSASSSSSLCDYRVRNGSNPKPFVSRTYIGGSASGSSLAMKIHRKNLQTRSDFLPMTSSLHHSCGSLSSLHETRSDLGLNNYLVDTVSRICLVSN